MRHSRRGSPWRRCARRRRWRNWRPGTASIPIRLMAGEQLLDHAAAVFGASPARDDGRDREMAELYAKIGRLTVERDFCPGGPGNEPAGPLGQPMRPRRRTDQRPLRLRLRQRPGVAAVGGDDHLAAAAAGEGHRHADGDHRAVELPIGFCRFAVRSHAACAFASVVRSCSTSVCSRSCSTSVCSPSPLADGGRRQERHRRVRPAGGRCAPVGRE